MLCACVFTLVALALVLSLAVLCLLLSGSPWRSTPIVATPITTTSRTAVRCATEIESVNYLHLLLTNMYMYLYMHGFELQSTLLLSNIHVHVHTCMYMKCSYMHFFCLGTSNKTASLHSRTAFAHASLMLPWLCTATTTCTCSNPTQGSFFFEKRESCSGCIYLPCFDLSCMPLSLDLGVFGGLIIPAFSFRLSLSSPVYQVSCFVPGFELSQLSCPGSSAGRANAECRGFESHPGQFFL